MDSKLDEALAEAEKELLPLQGVLGVGIGPKLQKGKIVDRHSIVSLVREKFARPEEVPGENQVIPKMIANLRTDVREPSLGPPSVGPRHPIRCCSDIQWIEWGKIHRICQENSINLYAIETHTKDNLFVIH